MLVHGVKWVTFAEKRILLVLHAFRQFCMVHVHLNGIARGAPPDKCALLLQSQMEVQSRLFARAPGTSDVFLVLRNGSSARLAIHCFTYDRPSSFQRLWASLMAARPAGLPTSVVIHVDYDDARSSEWQQQARISIRSFVCIFEFHLGPDLPLACLTSDRLGI